MPKSQRLHDAFEQAVTTVKNRRIFYGTLGDGEGTLFDTDSTGAERVGQVWCRLDPAYGQAAATRVVRCTKVPRLYGLKVKLTYDEAGVLEVIEADSEIAQEWGSGRGFNVGEHAWQHRGRYAPDLLLVEASQIVPFMVHPAYPASLSVEVEACYFRYLEANYQFAGATVDLTASVPANGGEQVVVVLTFNPATNAVVAVAGTAAVQITPDARLIPFTASDVNVIATGDNWRLAAIRLYNGQTEILWNDIFADLRQWIGSDIVSWPLILERGGTESDLSATGPGLVQQATAGAALSALKVNFAATGDPTVDDDTTLGYAVGSLWIDITGDKAWQCLDATDGVAVWHQLDLAVALDDLADVAITGAAQGDILIRDADDWNNVNIAVQRIVGRLTGEDMKGLTVAEVRTLLALPIYTPYDAVEIANSAAKTTLFTVSVGANEWEANGGIEIVIPMTIRNDKGSGGTIDITVDWGTSSFTFTTASFDDADTTEYTATLIVNIGNVGATNSQKLSAVLTVIAAAAVDTFAAIHTTLSGGAWDTASEDTTGAKTLAVSATLSAADPTYTLKTFNARGRSQYNA